MAIDLKAAFWNSTCHSQDNDPIKRSWRSERLAPISIHCTTLPLNMSCHWLQSLQLPPCWRSWFAPGDSPHPSKVRKGGGLVNAVSSDPRVEAWKSQTSVVALSLGNTIMKPLLNSLLQLWPRGSVSASITLNLATSAGLGHLQLAFLVDREFFPKCPVCSSSLLLSSQPPPFQICSEIFGEILRQKETSLLQTWCFFQGSVSQPCPL